MLCYTWLLYNINWYRGNNISYGYNNEPKYSGLKVSSDMPSWDRMFAMNNAVTYSKDIINGVP